MLRFCLNRGLERQVGTESLLRSLIALWKACTDLKRGCFRCVPPIFGNLWLLGCSNDNSPLRSCYQGPIVDDVRSLVGFHLEETPIAAESLGGVQWNRFWVYIHRKPSTMPPYWRQCQLSRRAKMSVSGSTQDCRWPPRTPTILHGKKEAGTVRPWSLPEHGKNDGNRWEIYLLYPTMVNDNENA